MSGSALIIGGTGLIGRALVAVLVRDGWDVTVVSRGVKPVDPSVRHVVADRRESASVRKLVRRGYDALFDVIALSATDADELSRLNQAVGTMVVVSSAAVYADGRGISLLNSPMERPVPLTEDMPTVAPDRDAQNYPGVKSYLERTLLEADPAPVTILRPGAVYGPGDTASREWHFVKRALDRRPFVVLREQGRSVFHQVASENVARLATRSATEPMTRVLNAGDAPPRSVRDTSRLIAEIMDHRRDELSVEADAQPETLGETPWSTPRPFVLDTSRSRALGYQPDDDARALMQETCRWLREATAGRPWEEALPAAARHYGALFDYEAEDDWFRSGAKGEPVS